MPLLVVGWQPLGGAGGAVVGLGAGGGGGAVVGLGAGGGGGWRGVNHTLVRRFWPSADTRTVTMTRIPGGALPSRNRNVCRPVASARAVFSRSPASKRATTVIRAPGAVDTLTPTVVPALGCFRVTDAVLVSGGGGGEVVGVGDGALVDAEGVPRLAVGLDFGEQATENVRVVRTSQTTVAGDDDQDRKSVV